MRPLEAWLLSVFCIKVIRHDLWLWTVVVVLITGQDGKGDTPFCHIFYID